MDPIYKFPASPGMPLIPVSPERTNRLLPQSPSAPGLSRFHTEHAAQHSHGTSDVQGKVAQFNNLSKEAAARRKENEAALKRAVMGREEAESETRRSREENRVLRKEVEEGRGRGRRLSERIEGLVEELGRTKEQLQKEKEKREGERAIYEKEVRRARKEAFKSSSALVNAQEEVKGARNRYTLMREECEEQRRAAAEKDQETFAARYELVGVREEVETLKLKMRVVEDERDALKMTLKEEVARIAAEGAVALPPSREAESPSSKKRSRKERESVKENMDPEARDPEDELMALKEDLRMEKRMRLKADDQVHFMKMECQFQSCSCRLAERKGVQYVHDNNFEKEVKEMEVKMDTKMIDQEAVAAEEAGPVADSERPSTQRQPPVDQQTVDQLIVFSPTTGTFSKATSPSRHASSLKSSISLESTINPIADASMQPAPEKETATATPSPPQCSPLTLPSTPRPLPNPPVMAPRTISHTTTTTTTIPLKDDFFSPAPNTPGGISREEALEQIRLRRGRARSYAIGNGLGGTPGKTAVEGRREISAPAGGKLQ